MEYLSDDYSPGSSPSSGRKRIVAGVGAAALVVIGGAAAYGFVQFMSSGQSAATAVPADAFGYLQLDLDPSGGQKVAAYETMRKFPALKEQLNLESDDDPRQWLIDAINSEAPEECRLDFKDDIEPWMGDKVALAGRDSEEGPQPFFVVEARDLDAAAETMQDAVACSGGEEDFGTATVGDFVVAAPSTELAEAFAADAEESSLSDDEAFQARMDDAGDAGIISGYVSPDVVDMLTEEMEGGQSTLPEGVEGDLPPSSSEMDFVRDYLGDFDGAAMQVRFADEGLEMEAASAGVKQMADMEGGANGLTELPGSTVFAFGMSVGPDFVQQMADAFSAQVSDEEFESQVQLFEQQTGIAFPEDVQTLLGDGLSLSLDSSIDLDALDQAFSTGQVEGVSVPAGIRIVSDDTGEVVDVLDKLQALLPPGLPVSMEVEEGDGAVAVGIDADYVSELATSGDLGESESFQDAVPDAEDSLTGMYVDFDGDGWLEDLVSDEDPETWENLEPLSSVGAGSTADGEDAHLLMRLTTD